MWKSVLLTLLVVLSSRVFASHIVGGEFELLHLSNSLYRLNLVLYFDEIGGNPLAKESSVEVYIYRKSDNTFMNSVVLNLNDDDLVPYTNPECDDGQLITARLLYTNTITLSSGRYDHPEGYYIAWERCCRNYTITNIVSGDPDAGEPSAGQTFYLEFPPVSKDGQRFINSTPRLFPPLRDYGCIGNFYYADFGGIDDDGDSLVYSLVTPYSTIDTENAYPITPNPGPYPPIIWEEGFELGFNIINGDPDLSITPRGILTVTPQTTGLYVFAVKVEEFRGGIKHGEMRRDFQMLVIADCEVSSPPTIMAKEKGASDFYKEGNMIRFEADDEEKCIDIFVTDPPTNEGDTSKVNIRFTSIDFISQLEGITVDDTRNVAIADESDTAQFTVCFPKCPFTQSGQYKIGIIAEDNSCPQPTMDTVIVSLNISLPPNALPFFEVDNTRRTGTATLVAADPNVNSRSSWELAAFDDDGDDVSLTIEPVGFDAAAAGITFSNVIYGEGSATTMINWSTDCLDGLLDYSAGRDVFAEEGVSKAFDIMVTADDTDLCKQEGSQMLLLTMIVNFPNETMPDVFTSLDPASSYVTLNYITGDRIVFPLKGIDEDGDRVRLTGMPLNFDFGDYDITFGEIEGEGVPGVSANFIWDLPCRLPVEMDTFRVRFFLEDTDVCQLTNIDTLDVDFIISPRPNDAPSIALESLNEAEVLGDSISVTIGELIALRVSVTDKERDITVLDIEDREENYPFSFDRVTGTTPIQSIFSWTPSCSDLKGYGLSRDMELYFTAADQNCSQPKRSEYRLVIHVEDINAGEITTLPPNVFTPNGDDSNDFFGMYQRDEYGDLINILPADNCEGQFEEVVIINRWGREVFRSNDREFRWDGGSSPSGVYFYQINYTNKEYRGSVSVLY